MRGRRGRGGIGADRHARGRAGEGREERTAEAVGLPLVLSAHPLEDFFKGVAAIGLEAVDLLQPEEWDIAAKYGLQLLDGYPARAAARFPTG